MSSKRKLWGGEVEVETLRLLGTAVGEGFSMTGEIVIAGEEEGGAVLYATTVTREKFSVENIESVIETVTDKLNAWLEANTEEMEDG